MKLRGLDHVGIIVERLDDAMTLFSRGLGMSQHDIIELPGIRTVFLRAGRNTLLELTEFTDPGLRAGRLAEGEQARIDHLAFEVDDLEGTLAELHALGIETSTSSAAVSSYRSAFAKPTRTAGISLQFLQRLEPSLSSPSVNPPEPPSR